MNLDRHTRSALVVCLLLVASLGVGWLVQTAVANQTRTITQDNITIHVPANWLTQDGVGEMVLQTQNPTNLDEQYRVSILRQSSNNLASLANTQGLLRIQQDDTYRVLEQTPIIIAGRDGFRVTYAFVDLQASLPTVIEGRDYYFPDGDNHVLLVSYENESHQFEAGLSSFQTFLSTLEYGG